MMMCRLGHEPVKVDILFIAHLIIKMIIVVDLVIMMLMVGPFVGNKTG